MSSGYIHQPALLRSGFKQMSKLGIRTKKHFLLIIEKFLQWGRDPILLATIFVSKLQVTGGRNGFGAKLANIFSTEFVIETCDGKRQRRWAPLCLLCHLTAHRQWATITKLRRPHSAAMADS